MVKVAAIIIARNEAPYIQRVVGAVIRQTLPIEQIIVVDDGSTDGTGRLAESMGATDIVTMPYHEKSHISTPKMAKKFNAGIAKVKAHTDYLLILGGDDLIPPDYVEQVIRRMDTWELKDFGSKSIPKIGKYTVIASGQATGEWTLKSAPRGAGRIVDLQWAYIAGMGAPLKIGIHGSTMVALEDSHIKYPELWCWEEYAVYKALHMGYRVACFEDITFQRLRPEPAKRSRQQALGDGKASYCIGTSWWTLIKRCIHITFHAHWPLIQHPVQAFWTFAGYVTAWYHRYEKADFAK